MKVSYIEMNKVGENAAEYPSTQYARRPAHNPSLPSVSRSRAALSLLARLTTITVKTDIHKQVS